MKFNEVQNVHAASHVDFTRPNFTVLVKQLGTVGGWCLCEYVDIAIDVKQCSSAHVQPAARPRV